MKISHLNYIFSILFFAGIAILVEWHRNKRVLKKYHLVIFFLAVASILFATTDFFALKWHAWFYYPGQNLNIKYFTEIETYVFALAVTVFCTIVTIIYATKLDKRASQSHLRRKR